MSVTWKKDGFDPSPFIKAIEQAKKIDNSGKIVFDGFPYHESSTMLHDGLSFPKGISEDDRRIIVYQAINRVCTQGKLNSDKFLSMVNRLVTEFGQQTQEVYYLVTSVSLDPFTKLRSFKICGATIIFSNQLPIHYQEERNKLITSAEQFLYSAKLPTNYLPVRIRILAKSIYEATDKALYSLDLLRGIWNLFYNQRLLTRMSFGSKEPVNNILLGPIHTLHKPYGPSATEIIWYETSYRKQIRPYKITNDIPDLYKYYKYAFTKLKSSNYRQDIENAIVGYSRALDERDWNTAFIKLWGILEDFTDTEKAHRDETIRRAAHVFSDYEYEYQILDNLRQHRN